jgi:tetratricopeptide (TPR) repeat protein
MADNIKGRKGVSTFGSLLVEGLWSVARRKSWTKAAIEWEVAEALGYSNHTVIRWQRGYVPARIEDVEFIVEYCFKQGRMDQFWARALLQSAHYPNVDAYLDKLDPPLPKPSSSSELQYLPARIDLLGRHEDLERVRMGLDSRFPLLSIEGLPGVGKTTLAIEVAYRALRGGAWELRSPFNKIVWISAKDRPTKREWLDEVLDTTARLLGAPNILKLPTDEKEKAIYGLIGQEKNPTLIILDSFEDMVGGEDVNSKEDRGVTALERWIQWVPGYSKVLLTLRPDRKARLDGLWHTKLNGLTITDALVLIRRHAQLRQLTNIAQLQEACLIPLAEITEGNPKLILLALGHVSFDTALALDDVVKHLKRAAPEVDDLLNYFIAWTWTKLRPNARFVLMAMSLFRTSASWQALGKVTGLDDYYLDVAMGELADFSLIQLSESTNLSSLTLSERSMQQYSVHPLVRAYSTTQMQHELEWQRQARARWLDWYRDIARKAVDPSNYISLRMEVGNLLAVMTWLSEDTTTPQDVRLGDLAWFLRRVQRFFFAQGHWSELHQIADRVYTWIESIKVSRPTEAAETLADILQTYISICTRTDAMERGKRWLEQASALAKELDVKQLKAEVSLGEGRLLEYSDYRTPIRMSEAEFESRKEALEYAVAVFKELIAPMPDRVMMSLNSLGKLYLARESYKKARGYFEEALHVLNVPENTARIVRAKRWEAAIRGNIAHVIGGIADKSTDNELRPTQFRIASQILRDIVVNLTDPDDLAEAYISTAYYEYKLGEFEEAWILYHRGDNLRQAYGLKRFLCAEDVRWQQLHGIAS